MLIEGAKGVDKTTIVTEFAKKEYDSYILIDFDKEDKKAHEFFRSGFGDSDSLFRSLSVYYNTPLIERKSLIIFDEIQKFPRIHEGMKYLIEDGRYDFIEIGSSITLKMLGMNITLPSEVILIKMYPMDFEEFLRTNNDEVTIPFLKTKFAKKEPVGQALHNRIMSRSRTYLSVGGMPQVVEQFLLDKVNLFKIDKIKREIINLYETDLAKYDNQFNTYREKMFSLIPSTLNSKNKTIKYSKIKKDGRFAAFYSTIDEIKKSMVDNVSYNVTDPSITITATKDPKSIKIFLLIQAY